MEIENFQNIMVNIFLPVIVFNFFEKFVLQETWKVFSTKFWPQGKDQNSGYQGRECWVRLFLRETFFEN